MHNLRTVGTGGILKKYLSQLEQRREYDVDRKEEIDEEHLYFDWRYKNEKYRLIK